MNQKMKNPYRGESGERDVSFGKGTATAFAAVFLILIAGPAVWRNAIELAKGNAGWAPLVEVFRVTQPSLLAHFTVFEERLERESEFAAGLRRGTQAMMTRVFREGNRRTMIGRDGWLFYRPALDSLTGKGPGPERAAVIARFGEQLREMGVELILVPIPTKPMVYPNRLGGGREDQIVERKDAEGFYDRLRAGGVQVVELTDLYAAEKESTEMYLKQDTHWTPEGLQSAAELVAAHVKERPWFEELEAPLVTTVEKGIEVENDGDGVRNLDLGDRTGAFFERERITISRVVDTRTKGSVALNNVASPIVLLGDSFTNIYSRGEMGFGAGAGFADHLAGRLGMALDVIAINGQGTTAVRRELAGRSYSAWLMRDKKKAVIWAIVERDLFLTDASARAEGVVWEDVAFNEGAIEGAPLTLVGTVRMKSRIPDPRLAPYREAFFAVEYTVENVIEGEYNAEVIVVFHWAFRDGKMSEASRFPVGARKTLRLVPFHERADELRWVGNTMNDSIEDNLVPYWAEGVE